MKSILNVVYRECSCPNDAPALFYQVGLGGERSAASGKRGSVMLGATIKAYQQSAAAMPTSTGGKALRSN